MNLKFRTIEVDAMTADVLEARAAARGLTVSELIADLAVHEAALPADIAGLRANAEGPWSADILAEDAERLAQFKRAREGVPWDEVKAWMQSWGSPHEVPAPKPRKL
jgi:hypothetical protein